MLQFLIFASVILLSFFALFIWAAGGIQSPREFEDAIFDYRDGAPREESGAAPGIEKKLTLMTWNIAYAREKGQESREKMNQTLREIGKVIVDRKVDIVFFQEIDFDSRRSHYVDQLKFLSEVTGLRYGARSLSWKAGFIPHPDHLGKMRSGGAVLSRFPLVSNRVYLHKKPQAYSWYYRLFYLFRHSQKVEIQFGDRRFWVVNNHLEAFIRENREAQARVLAQLAESMGESLWFFAGDMNAPPPEIPQSALLKQEEGEDYEGDSTIATLRSVPGFKEMKTNGVTFPPNWQLDYIFARDGLRILKKEILQTGKLSDHLPVVIDVSVE